MWVSSTSTDGDIGGVNGATAICETDASSSAPIAGLTHRAVIATSANDPSNYFSNNPPVQRPDGTVITDAYAEFFDNVGISSSVNGVDISFWTGLENNGAVSTDNCTAWTGTGGNGQTGKGNENSDSDRFSYTVFGCNTGTVRILCISY